MDALGMHTSAAWMKELTGIIYGWSHIQQEQYTGCNKLYENESASILLPEWPFMASLSRVPKLCSRAFQSLSHLLTEQQQAIL